LKLSLCIKYFCLKRGLGASATWTGVQRAV